MESNKRKNKLKKSGKLLTKENWITELKIELRNDLVHEITDKDIANAIVRYRRWLINYMVNTGELTKVRGSKPLKFEKRSLSGSGDPDKPGIIESTETIFEKDILLPYPSTLHYNRIVGDIWKRKHYPTFTFEFSLEIGTILKDKRAKTDDRGLTLTDYAIMYYYVEESGQYFHQKHEKERIESFIKRREIKSSYENFRPLVNKFLRVEDRWRSGALNRIQPWVETWYCNALALIHRDVAKCLKMESKGKDSLKNKK